MGGPCMCGAEDCPKCYPGCNDPVECSGCGKVFAAHEILECPKCESNFICDYCKCCSDCENNEEEDDGEG